MTGRRRRLLLPRGARGDGGYAPVELAPVATCFLLFLALIVAAGRATLAVQAVHAAAQDAARQASIARTPQAAAYDARSSALAVLAGDGLDCAPQVTVSTSGFAVPPGQPAQVSASVTCPVRLAGLLVPGIPGSIAVSASAFSFLDPYRGR